MTSMITATISHQASQKTIDRLTQKLIGELQNHPFADEVIALALDQLLDMDE